MKKFGVGFIMTTDCLKISFVIMILFFCYPLRGHDGRHPDPDLYDLYEKLLRINEFVIAETLSDMEMKYGVDYNKIEFRASDFLPHTNLSDILYECDYGGIKFVMFYSEEDNKFCYLWSILDNKYLEFSDLYIGMTKEDFDREYSHYRKIESGEETILSYCLEFIGDLNFEFQDNILQEVYFQSHI